MRAGGRGGGLVGGAGGLVFAAKWMFLFQRCLRCSSSFTPRSHWSTDPPPHPSHPLPLQDRRCCGGLQDEEEEGEEQKGGGA